MTEVGSIVGTAQYLSPEQARGRASARSPISTRSASCSTRCWPAGCRSRATRRSTIAMKQVSDPPPPLNRQNRLVSAAIEQVVMRALAKDPALRHSAAKQMAEELARVSRGQSASSRHAAGDPGDGRGRGHPRHRPPTRGRRASCPPRPPPPPERPAPRRSALPWLLVLLLLAWRLWPGTSSTRCSPARVWTCRSRSSADCNRRWRSWRRTS